jgi:hypothetical protein
MRVSPRAVLGLPALAVLLVAAANTPGWLWDSEAGGYDALSYHLQLPQEWLMAGRIRPLAHNVYSYLPGYVESAFYALAVMMGESSGGSGRVGGLVAGEGLGVISCQMLSAGIAVMAAWMVGRLVRGACVRVGCERGAGGAGVFAAVFMLSTPWTVVVGSLAYNDLGVVLFFAAAMLAAIDEGGAAWRRGLVCGVLVGVACGCKPTALFMAGLPVGVVMVGMPRKAREIAVMVAAGAAGGLVVVLPWLVRNWAYGGNPVFPLAASVFGAAHWSAEQVGRYGAGHAFGWWRGGACADAGAAGCRGERDGRDADAGDPASAVVCVCAGRGADGGGGAPVGGGAARVGFDAGGFGAAGAGVDDAHASAVEVPAAGAGAGMRGCGAGAGVGFRGGGARGP